LKEITLVLGGARSGKSSWALEYVENSYNSYMFLATAEVLDDEMAHRVELHREARGPKWQVREEPLEIAKVGSHRAIAMLKPSSSTAPPSG
jgi:adenosylcobinamide kinase/adenosylcobinamide-phosphate guanylyltransferase